MIKNSAGSLVDYISTSRHEEGLYICCFDKKRRLAYLLPDRETTGGGGVLLGLEHNDEVRRFNE